MKVFATVASVLQLLLTRGSTVGIFPEIQRFLTEHRDCGEPTKEAGRPSADGYRIHVACPCGALLDRWVTPEDARYDLVHTSLLAGRN